MLTGTRTHKSFQSSELSRNSARVFAAAEDQPVEVTRRDGEDLVLMAKSEADARHELLQLAATLIGVATDTRGTLAERMADALPWMLALSPPTRRHAPTTSWRSARSVGNRLGGFLHPAKVSMPRIEYQPGQTESVWSGGGAFRQLLHRAVPGDGRGGARMCDRERTDSLRAQGPVPTRSAAYRGRT